MKKEKTSHTSENDSVNTESPSNEESSFEYPKGKIRIGLILTIFGYLIFLLGARPSIFNLDRSRVIGFVQISVLLIGLAIISLGSYLTLNALWPPGTKTIAADIGSRLISTGYVICVFTGMADIFGLGSHRLPNVFFGALQARGVSIGMATIAVGFLLLIRYKRDKPKPKGKAKQQPAKSKEKTTETPPAEKKDQPD
jgi:hypothetical protein